jgi:hypothetical protein
MKYCRLASVALFVVLSMLTVGVQAQQSRPSKMKSVTGSGCVTAGVEAGCKMLRDTKTNELFSLFFSGDNDPGLNIGIRFKGNVHEGPANCMQGKAIEVVKWSKIKMNCSQAPKSNR